jgi:hypothetical protein
MKWRRRPLFGLKTAPQNFQLSLYEQFLASFWTRQPTWRVPDAIFVEIAIRPKNDRATVTIKQRRFAGGEALGAVFWGGI